MHFIIYLAITIALAFRTHAADSDDFPVLITTSENK